VKEEKDESASFSNVSSAVRGVSFPIHDEVLSILEGSPVELVILKIEDEKIVLDFSGDCSIQDLASKVVSDSPRFIFWYYRHTFENEELSNLCNRNAYSHLSLHLFLSDYFKSQTKSKKKT
jgi:restriction endonuclease S subunit